MVQVDHQHSRQRRSPGEGSISRRRADGLWVGRVQLEPAADGAQILGHSDPAVTLRSYGHIVPEAHRDAMELMDRYIRDLDEPTDQPVEPLPFRRP